MSQRTYDDNADQKVNAFVAVLLYLIMYSRIP